MVDYSSTTFLLEKEARMEQAILWATGGTIFTFLMTAAGAAMVLLFQRGVQKGMEQAFVGFAAGVMLAAAVWSLLIPAIEDAEKMGQIGWMPAAVGFVTGVLFLVLCDKLFVKLRQILMLRKEQKHSTDGGEEDEVKKRVFLLLVAVTLHNIPEGMATGLAFAMAGMHPKEPAYFAGAFTLALGIGIQNLPEGAAISLPLQKAGIRRGKAFLAGSLSGIVEPFFGILSTLAAVQLVPWMPWLLSFAAGAMLYVVVEELIPEAHRGECSYPGTVGVMAGFLLMMILDVSLG